VNDLPPDDPAEALKAHSREAVAIFDQYEQLVAQLEACIDYYRRSRNRYQAWAFGWSLLCIVVMSLALMQALDCR
jgi:hypothetical protein